MIKDVIELTKPRICLLSVLMSALGFLFSNSNSFQKSIAPFLFSILGITLVGAACGILNQYLEIETDQKMKRTDKRPLVKKTVSEVLALFLSAIFSIVGLVIIFFGVNPLSALLSFLTLITYLLIYTPSKQISSISTLIGAVPGALPPLIGSVSACGAITGEGLTLFAILFIWQIPHFLAIGWMYQEDYAMGFLPILPVVDKSGYFTSKHILLYSLILIPITVLPTLFHMAGYYYLCGSLLLGGWFFYHAVQLSRDRIKQKAKKLFFVSIIYLPLLTLLLVLDKV